MRAAEYQRYMSVMLPLIRLPVFAITIAAAAAAMMPLRQPIISSPLRRAAFA